MSDRYGDELRERDRFLEWYRGYLNSSRIDEDGHRNYSTNQWDFSNEAVQGSWEIWVAASRVRE